MNPWVRSWTHLRPGVYIFHFTPPPSPGEMKNWRMGVKMKKGKIKKEKRGKKKKIKGKKEGKKEVKKGKIREDREK